MTTVSILTPQSLSALNNLLQEYDRRYERIDPRIVLDYIKNHTIVIPEGSYDDARVAFKTYVHATSERGFRRDGGWPPLVLNPHISPDPLRTTVTLNGQGIIPV